MPFITAANAKALSALAIEAKRTKLSILPPAQVNVGPVLDHYLVRRLSRVRRQIDALSDDLDNETDALKKDRLASAIARLSEIERQLANRPLPGSWKPQQPGRAIRAVAIPQLPSTPQVVDPPANNGA